MMTVITEVTIEPGQEPQWDRAFQERIDDVRNQPGWIEVQLLIPVDAPNKRVVVGTWRSRADWEAWHETEVFKKTKEIMDAVEQQKGEDRWFEVVTRQSAEGATSKQAR
ncbi:hypothetical protein HRbin26_01199 [bacterium HR26]|nr:hypothetical protein HRbin26_01199 [bacterium HR26]